MNRPRKRFYEFDRFRFDTTNWQLLRDGRPLALKPKALETLLLLIEKQGQVLGKEELMKALWPDSFVEEANLTQNIYILRKALGDKGYIETVPRRGYRFTIPIQQWDEADSDLVIRERARVVIEEQEEVEDSKTGIMPATPASAMRTRAGLRWRVLLASVILAVLGAAGYYLRGRIQSNATGPGIRSIAVLPFKSLGADDEYLGLGMADALITRMTHLRHVAVRPTSDVRKYTDLQQDTARRAGQELRVDAVLEGTVQRSGNDIRIRVQLVRVDNGASIWADQFDEPATNIFRLQDSISSRVTHVLAPKLSAEEKQSLAKGDTENAAAYDDYMKGRYFWNKRSEGGMAKAFAYFQHAIVLDPNYALAYVGLADCYLFGQPRTMPPNALLANGKAMAKKALEIDPDLGEAHATLGLIAESLGWTWDEAEKEYKRAIELNPNYATAHHWYGEFLTLRPGRFDESLEEMKIARDLDPLSLVIIKDTGEVYYAARKYDQAIEYFDKALEMDASFIPARRLLAMTYVQKQDYGNAILELQTVISQEDAPDALAELGYAYALSGRKLEAKRILRVLQQQSGSRYTSPRDYALVYEGLGEKDKAFRYLEAAFREGSVLPEFKVDARWDLLRGDPRFADLLKSAGMG